MTTRHPNLFLVGAPKSGTTTLNYWLDQHTDVFMSNNKEPRFFCDFSREASYRPNTSGFIRNLVVNPDDYAALFAEARDEKWIGESSTDYLWTENACEKIFSATRDKGTVRIIAVLRNPVERAFSEHSALIRDGLENLSFLESLDAEDERYADNWLPLFYHKRRSAYSSGLARYIDTFGRNSVGIFLFDDLVTSPTTFMRDVCNFLDIPPLPENPDVKFNRSGVPRSRFIQGIERNDNLLKSAIQAVTTRNFRTRLKLAVQKLNLRKLRMSVQERDAAYNLFEEDIDRTEKIIGRDLSAWKL